MTTTTEARGADAVLADAAAIAGGSAKFNKQSATAVINELVGLARTLAAAPSVLAVPETGSPVPAALDELLAKLVGDQPVFPCPGAPEPVARLAHIISELQATLGDKGDGTPRLATELTNLKKKHQELAEVAERRQVLLAEATSTEKGLREYASALEHKLKTWKAPMSADDEIVPTPDDLLGRRVDTLRDARAYAGGADGSRAHLQRCIRDLLALYTKATKPQ